MIRVSFLIVTIGLLLQFTSCNDDFDSTVLSTGKLTFSRDTVYLDTIFTNISSSTRTLKVYNRSKNNITIPSVQLGRGQSSYYRLNVDGMDGKTFQDVDILAKDSIYIFIEATIDFDEVNNPIYTDSIVFDTDSNMQDVDLVSLVQDAHFLYPAKDSQGVKEKIVLGSTDDGVEIAVEGFYLEKNTVWKNDKPYVIYGYAGVPEDGSLIIEKGVRVHFHNNSGLLVEKNATLKVNGEIDDEVIFEGDRLEPFYNNIAGQWGTIWLRAESKNHEVKNAIIKNNTIGMLVETGSPSNATALTLSNTQIYNTASFGVLGRNTAIQGENVVIGNNGMASLACTLGGSYDFTHSTFANYWNSGIRLYPTLLLNNYENGESGSPTVFDLVQANFTNCIIDGNHNIEMILDNNSAAEFHYNFKNCMIKFDDSNGNYLNDPLYDFGDTNYYQNVLLNGRADFKSIENNEFVIGQESDAIDKADQNAALIVPFDLLNVSRIQNPDIGAYQHIEIDR